MTAAPDDFQPRVGDIARTADCTLWRVTATTRAGVIAITSLTPPHPAMTIRADAVTIHEPHPGRTREPAARLRAIKWAMRQGRHEWDAYDGPTPDERGDLPQASLDAEADRAADKYDEQINR